MIKNYFKKPINHPLKSIRQINVFSFHLISRFHYIQHALIFFSFFANTQLTDIELKLRTKVAYARSVLVCIINCSRGKKLYIKKKNVQKNNNKYKQVSE